MKISRQICKLLGNHAKPKIYSFDTLADKWLPIAFCGRCGAALPCGDWIEIGESPVCDMKYYSEYPTRDYEEFF